LITKIPYKFIFLISITLIALLLAYANNFGQHVYAPISVMISAVAAITAAAVTIKSNRHTFMQTNSLSFQQDLQSDSEYKRSLIIVRAAMNNSRKKPLTEYAHNSKVITKEDKRTLKAIRYVLNTWEQAAASCRHNLYDEYHLYQSYKSMVIQIGIQFRDFIHEVQELRNNPDIYNNFTWLTLHWTIRRDDFVNEQRGKELKLIYKQLNTIEAGKLPKKKHKLKRFRH
jgi:hypothetical protein